MDLAHMIVDVAEERFAKDIEDASFRIVVSNNHRLRTNEFLWIAVQPVPASSEIKLTCGNTIYTIDRKDVADVMSFHVTEAQNRIRVTKQLLTLEVFAGMSEKHSLFTEEKVCFERLSGSIARYVDHMLRFRGKRYSA